MAVVASCGSVEPKPDGSPSVFLRSHPRAVKRAPLRAARRPIHHSRPPHSIFDDEIGEDIVGLHTRYRTVIERYGLPKRVPARYRHRYGMSCIYYDLVGHPRDGWEFCFRHGRMQSASDGPEELPAEFR